MIVKRYRLSRKDFTACYKSAKIVASSLFVFKFKKNLLDYNRWSVVISKKISKKATLRNKLKRRIYEILKKHPTNLKIDGIIYPRLMVLNLTYEKLGFEIDSLLSKIPGFF
jgi:ribonuclease P protein component